MKKCFGEFVGTFILCLFGLGSLHAAVLAGAHVGLFQIAMIWGIGLSLAIYSCGAICNTHLNPAMTIAFAAFTDFPKKLVLPYICSQLLGAFSAAAFLFAVFNPALLQYEAVNNIVRGTAGSEFSSMIYAEYFPNPGMAKSMGWNLENFPIWIAMLAEGFGTMMLAFFVFSLTDKENKSGPSKILAPLFIGFCISVLIAVFAPISQAGFNPARDFGPRLFAYFQGWGEIAIPGPRGGFFLVYILSPIIGALLGALSYKLLRKKEEDCGCFIVK